MQSKEKFDRLINSKKFDVVKFLHKNWIETIPMELVRAQLFVQRADPSLMFRHADNVKGNGRHYIARERGEVGTRHEVAYLVARNNTILGAQFYTEFDGFQRVKDFFNGFSDYDAVAYILWVTQEEWYEKPTDEAEEKGAYYGEQVSFEMTYTVYFPPKDGGFKKLIAEADITKNVELTERTLTRGLIEHDPLYEAASKRLSVFAKKFELKVYTMGLMDTIDSSNARGMSGNFGGVEVMSWVMCARIMITMEAPNPANPKLRDSFTIIGNEPRAEAKFGWRSICATADRAAELVETVIKSWQSVSADKRSKFFKDNKDVKLAGM
jgi:hypothetical protein